MKDNIKATIKSLYMFILRLIPVSRRFKHYVVYVMTFNENDAGLTDRLFAEYGQRLLVLYGPNATQQANRLAKVGVQTLKLSAKSMVLHRGIAYLRGATTIVVDNYVAELALVPDGTEVYQVWHAAGAIKKFGWDDPATSTRPISDQHRFQQVYNKFTHIVVGSRKMGEIFQRAYRIPASRIMTTGFLRSDEYANMPKAEATTDQRVLYVPTYRASDAEMLAVLRQAFAAFAQVPDMQVVMKLHPTVKLETLPNMPKNVTISKQELTHLMPQARVLITDYSSALFEYSLIVKTGRTIFFCPDIDDYRKTPGIQDDFTDWHIGKVVYTEAELVTNLRHVDALPCNNEDVNQMWNTYNDGYAVARLYEEIVRRKMVE